MSLHLDVDAAGVVAAEVVEAELGVATVDVARERLLTSLPRSGLP